MTANTFTQTGRKGQCPSQTEGGVSHPQPQAQGPGTDGSPLPFILRFPPGWGGAEQTAVPGQPYRMAMEESPGLGEGTSPRQRREGLPTGHPSPNPFAVMRTQPLRRDEDALTLAWGHTPVSTAGEVAPVGAGGRSRHEQMGHTLPALNPGARAPAGSEQPEPREA